MTINKLIKEIEDIINYYKREVKETHKDYTKDLIIELEHLKDKVEQLGGNNGKRNS